MPTPEIVSYAEIATMMGISPAGAQKVALNDPEFPAAVTPPSMRSRGWDRSEIESFIAARAARSSGRSGRPPLAGSKRYKLPEEVNLRIRDRIREAGTLAEFLRLAEISDNALRQRFAGKTTWREMELDRFAQRLGISFFELTGIKK